MTGIGALVMADESKLVKCVLEPSTLWTNRALVNHALSACLMHHSAQ
jgi:hypothetical protein